MRMLIDCRGCKCSLLAAACWLVLSMDAAAQMGTTLYAGPRGTTTIAPPPGPGPLDPLSVAAYWGFWPNPVIARQPIGHQIIATSPNGYVYRPVYADDNTAASIALPDPRESAVTPLAIRQQSISSSSELFGGSALALFKAGRYEATIDRLNRQLDAKPDDGDAWLLLVQCYFGLTNYEAAAEALAAALAYAPEHDWDKYIANYPKYFASSLRFAMHLRSLERFVELHPEQTEGHLLLGYQYGSLGKIDRALAELALAKPNVEAETLTNHFAAAQDAPAPAPDEDLNGPAPNRVPKQPPGKRRGREF